MLGKAKPILILFLVAAVFASASGLLLAVHLHHEDCEHDSKQCDVCMALISGPVVAAEQAAISISLPVRGESVFRIARAEPYIRFINNINATRAPPLA